jgi:outer membrane protein OmpA-like peptidoglycan-associated protein
LEETMLALCWKVKQGLRSSGDPEASLRLSLKALLVGAALIVATAPAAQAQSDSEAIAQPGAESPGHYLVTFHLDQATLTEADRDVVAQAAEYYRQGGTPQVTVTGYTDTSGSAAHNLELSQRRAEVVAEELVRDGVPATDIVTIGRGEEDLRVPTADGVREARNRRAEIIMGPPPPPAVVAAPAPAPVEVEEEEEARRSVLTIGPVYGHNWGETNRGNQNDLVGGELVYNAFPGFLGGASLKQAVLYSFNGENDGLNGRSAVSLDFAPDLGIVRPFLSANFGGVYGGGVQDGIIFGPEAGFNLNLIEAVDMRAKVAYDFQARELGWGDGILWTGLGFGIGF